MNTPNTYPDSSPEELQPVDFYNAEQREADFERFSREVEQIFEEHTASLTEEDRSMWQTALENLQKTLSSSQLPSYFWSGVQSYIDISGSNTGLAITRSEQLGVFTRINEALKQAFWKHIYGPRIKRSDSTLAYPRYEARKTIDIPTSYSKAVLANRTFGGVDFDEQGYVSFPTSPEEIPSPFAADGTIQQFEEYDVGGQVANAQYFCRQSGFSQSYLDGRLCLPVGFVEQYLLNPSPEQNINSQKADVQSRIDSLTNRPE